ncbi:tetratricopeptide repeat protein [Nafulsella turpanensis]|uniref:tetratricopeptide repeat protein n=1 Tax=Nafulsella turpanensis TaxID=1265690 RepID=UPI00034880D3|nr:DnaJ domain-containing protein [Nafulsella turpanensis]
MINYYHILGVSRRSSAKEIKEAYRQLALRYHPDRNPGSSYAEERFKEISHAYQVLKNPLKKEQHDHMLDYQDFQAQTIQPQQEQAYKQASNGASYSPPPYTGRRQRNPYSWQPYHTPPFVSRRQNMVATAWAFGIFFAIAAIVMGLGGYQSYQHEKELAEQAALSESIYEKAVLFYQKQNYADALAMLKSLNKDYSLSYEAGLLRQQILGELEQEANQHFEQANYKRAAELFELLAQNQPGYNALTYAKLVNSYEMTEDYEKAIRTYKKVVKAEPFTIEARTRMAALFLKMENYEEALKQYHDATNIVVQEYQNLYGQAYALVVNPVKTPESHYQLHCGLGQTYTRLGMHKKAQKALDWAIFLRPENPTAYLLQGQNFFQWRQKEDACAAWAKAAELGSKEAKEAFRTHCR